MDIVTGTEQATTVAAAAPGIRQEEKMNYTATFSKIRGQWGVRMVAGAPADLPAATDGPIDVAVRKRDGSEKVVTAQVTWAGRNKFGEGYVALAKIVRQARAPRRQSPDWGRRYAPRRFDEDEGVEYKCRRCGTYCRSGEFGYCRVRGR